MSMFMDAESKLDMPLDAIIAAQAGTGADQTEDAFNPTQPLSGAGPGDANRRVFVGNLSFHTSWQELKDHMRSAGEVTHAQVLTGGDGRSKGCGIVEFAAAQDAANAIATLHDTELNGRLIFVREDRESVGGGGGQRAQQGGFGRPLGSAGPPGQAPFRTPATQARRVYVGNLSWDVAWQDLKDHMRSIGEVVHADVLCGPDGRSKGCGIVEFSNENEAKAAIARLQDTMLKGRPIFVREDREGGSGGAPRAPHHGHLSSAPAPQGGAAPMGVMHPGAFGFPPQAAGTGALADLGAPLGGPLGAGGPISNRVFVGNLSWDVTWQDLKDCMRRAGSVVRADVLSAGGKSKGCGIVEFETSDDAARAIAMLTNFKLKGRPIFVREDREASAQGAPMAPAAHPHAAAHVPQQAYAMHGVMDYDQGPPQDQEAMDIGAYAMAQQPSDRAGRQLFVGNLSWSTTWQSLKDHFRGVGEVEYVEVAAEPRGRSKGYGTVRYATADLALAAIQAYHDSELDGRNILVRLDQHA